MKQRKYIDLHLHSNYSDGLYEPETLVKAVKLKGIDVFALTDHDITSGVERAAKEADKWNIEIIPGVEVSTRKYHILGLNVDIYNQDFQKFLSEVRDIQEDICKKRIDILQDYGVPINFEKVKRNFPFSRIGKCNLFMTLVKDKECSDYILRDIGDKTPREIFNYYLWKNGIAGKIKKVEEVHSKQAIKKIHDAGGLAIIAHPFKDVDSFYELDKLVGKGIDGLEVQPNYCQENEPFKKYAQEKGLLVTYGSDYHGPIFDRNLLERGENIMDEELEDKLSKEISVEV
jgi:hypothetical protein